jgi:hypothetical protein
MATEALRIKPENGDFIDIPSVKFLSSTFNNQVVGSGTHLERKRISFDIQAAFTWDSAKGFYELAYSNGQNQKLIVVATKGNIVLNLDCFILNANFSMECEKTRITAFFVHQGIIDEDLYDNMKMFASLLPEGHAMLFEQHTFTILS